MHESHYPYLDEYLAALIADPEQPDCALWALACLAAAGGSPEAVDDLRQAVTRVDLPALERLLTDWATPRGDEWPYTFELLSLASDSAKGLDEAAAITELLRAALARAEQSVQALDFNQIGAWGPVADKRREVGDAPRAPWTWIAERRPTQVSSDLVRLWSDQGCSELAAEVVRDAVLADAALLEVYRDTLRARSQQLRATIYSAAFGGRRKVDEIPVPHAGHGAQVAVST